MVRSRVALAALAVLATGCLDNQKIGPQAAPPAAGGGAMFANYIALGTSISAGVQSGGISDSTQKRAFPYLLAGAMGLSVNVNWFYPGFTPPGCPAPYTNPLTGDRVGGGNDSSGAGTACNLIYPPNVPARQSYYNNLGTPSMKVGQALNILSIPDPRTDVLAAAQFITGARSPVSILQEAKPTFVTVELGANDALHAATSGDTTELTPLAVFTRQYDSLAAAIAATGAKVALANVPNVDNIPYLTRGIIFFCRRPARARGFPPRRPSARRGSRWISAAPRLRPAASATRWPSACRRPRPSRAPSRRAEARASTAAPAPPPPRPWPGRIRPVPS